MQNSFYPIGEMGTPWNEYHKTSWLKQCEKQRSYQTEVIEKIKALSTHFDCLEYGELNYPNCHLNQQSFPLFALKTKNWQSEHPTILITGGRTWL